MRGEIADVRMKQDIVKDNNRFKAALNSGNFCFAVGANPSAIIFKEALPLNKQHA